MNGALIWSLGMNSKSKKVFIFTLFFSFNLYSAVFINGVKIPEMKDQIFDNSEVIFNQDGDIHIYVKGVMLVPENSDIKKTEGKYYLIVNAPDIQKISWMFINGKEFEFNKKESMIPQEISSLLQKGKNTLTVKIPESSKDEKISIIIGTGIQKEGKLEITSVAEYNIKLTAVKSFKVFTFELENK